MKLGLIGETLGHSLSPAIHQNLFAQLGISGTYDLIEIPREDLGEHIPRLLGVMDGFNVTIPYKTDVIPFLAGLSPEAARIGAVNTVAVRDGKGYGYNTDYLGFSRTLDAIGADPDGRDAVVLGTGGAARAVIQCLFDRGAAYIRVVTRKREAVGGVFRDFADAHGADIITYGELEAGCGAFLLVNATPCGMSPHAGVSPVSERVVRKCHAVVDLIYNPAETELLRMARESGADCANGLLMLASQGAAAEEIWLGRELPADLAPQLAARLEQGA